MTATPEPLPLSPLSTTLYQSAYPAMLELMTYLGPRFDPALLTGTDAQVNTDFARHATPEAFYRDTEVYLYHLLMYHLEGWKRPYYASLLSVTGGMPGISLLDYGCGIGSDGLLFLDLGFTVAFADVPSQSLDFLRWRLWHRRYTAPPVYEIVSGVYTRAALSVPLHEIVWCMDVVEHLPASCHAWLLTEHLPSLGEIVLVNLVEDHAANNSPVHTPLDAAALTALVCQHWPVVHLLDFYLKPDGSMVRLLMYGHHVTN